MLCRKAFKWKSVRLSLEDINVQISSTKIFCCLFNIAAAALFCMFDIKSWRVVKSSRQQSTHSLSIHFECTFCLLVFFSFSVQSSNAITSYGSDLLFSYVESFGFEPGRRALRRKKLVCLDSKSEIYQMLAVAGATIMHISTSTQLFSL